MIFLISPIVKSSLNDYNSNNTTVAFLYYGAPNLRYNYSPCNDPLTILSQSLYYHNFPTYYLRPSTSLTLLGWVGRYEFNNPFISGSETVALLLIN